MAFDKGLKFLFKLGGGEFGLTLGYGQSALRVEWGDVFERVCGKDGSESGGGCGGGN